MNQVHALGKLPVLTNASYVRLLTEQHWQVLLKNITKFL